jgi:hypothetical protein
VSQALAPPFLVAALVLCIAGVSKLRAPGTAAAATGTRPGVIRALALGELAVGAVGAIHPIRAGAVVLAVVYLVFAVVALVLRRRRVVCGCFGDNGLPVSLAHVIASELLGALALAAALAGPRGLGWLAGQPGITAAALAVGVAGAAYATVLVYTAVPPAWATWSGE